MHRDEQDEQNARQYLGHAAIAAVIHATVNPAPREDKAPSTSLATIMASVNVIAFSTSA
jgi:hypothetical protein